VTSRKRANGPFNAIARAIDQVADAARDAPAGGSQINIARRTNIKVAKNVGHDGGTVHASATQVAPINQQGSKKSPSGTNRGAVENE